MMFLNYFVWGCWFVTIYTYMTKTLLYGDDVAGNIFSTYAIAAMISPFFVGMVADRFFATQHILGALHLIGAGLMYGVSVVQDSGMFFVLLMAYTLCYMPTISLTNSLSFHHVSSQEKDFPMIRVFGTIGWIAAGMLVGLLALELTAVPMQLAAGSSILMGLFAFTLPHTPPPGKGTPTGIREVLGLDAIALMKDRSFGTIIVSSFLVCIPLAFYYSLTNIYLVESGVQNSAALQTMGQMSEVVFLVLMPLLFVRWGIKNVIIIGISAWILRYILFAYGNNDTAVWMLYTGIILHGVCYDFFFVAGQIFIDKSTPEKLRGAAQGLLTFATYGVGLFLGTIISGQVAAAFKTVDAAGVAGHDWTTLWWVPAILAAVILPLFILFFKEKRQVA